MNPRRILLACSLIFFGAGRLPADVYFSAAPSSVDDNQSYYVEAVSWDNGAMDNTVYKNGNWFTDSWGQGACAGAWTSDSGPTTVDYMAEAYNWQYGASWAYASVGVGGGQPPPTNNPPTAWVEVDGYGSGATVVRPYGGSITVTIRYKASDPDGNLQHIRPQVWHPDSGLFTNDNGGWTGVDGGSGEVVRTITLDRNGDWYLWTDAEDWPGVFVNSGAWGDAFRLHVVEGAPPNSAPVITLTSPSAQTITVGTALTISSHATDVDGNLSHHHLDIQRPDGSWNWQGGFANGEPYNGGPVGSAADSTRSASFTFDQVGTWHVRSWANDTNNANLHSVTVAITVNQVAGPGVPQNLQVSGITSSSFTLSWSSPGGNVSGYQVLLNNGSAISASGLSYTFTGLASNTSYSAQVQALNAGGGSGWVGAGVTTSEGSGGGGGSASAQSIWAQVPLPNGQNDGIPDEIIKAGTSAFSYEIDSWYTTNFYYTFYPVDDFWYSAAIAFGGQSYSDFTFSWIPEFDFWVGYQAWFSLVFHIEAQAYSDYLIYRDRNGSTTLNPSSLEIVGSASFITSALQDVIFQITNPGYDLDGVNFYLVKPGLPASSLQVTLPGLGVLKVSSNGSFGSLTLPNGTTITVSGGSVTVSGVGTVNPSGSLSLPGGTVIQVDGGGNASITIPGGTIVTVSSQGALGLSLPPGTPSLLAKAVDVLGRVLNVNNNGVVFSVKNALGQIVNLPNNGALDVLDIGIDQNGNWQIGVKLGSQSDNQTIWFNLNVQTGPPTKILLLLHGMNSSIDTWQSFVSAHFGNSVGDIIERDFSQSSAPTPNNHGVYCYRLQFGYNEQASTLEGLEHVSATNTQNYITPGNPKTNCGDFQSFDELGQQVEYAVNLLRERHQNAQIILLGHSRGGIAARAFLQSLPPLTFPPVPSQAKAAVVALLTTSTPHKGGRMGRIYHWLDMHPRNTGHNGDWDVVDFLKPDVDVRRPVISDVALGSLAIQSLNDQASVQRLPAGIRYSEIVNDKAALGLLINNGLKRYSVFSGGSGFGVGLITQQLNSDATTDILGGGAYSPETFHGDGLVEATSQTFTDLQGFQGNAIASLVVDQVEVVHTDAPLRTGDLIIQLRFVMPGWFE